jgi:hypothetical protein
MADYPDFEEKCGYNSIRMKTAISCEPWRVKNLPLYGPSWMS